MATQNKRGQSRKRRRSFRINPLYLLLAAPVGVFLYLCWDFFFLQDDAFITLRFADNFLSGHGLVWNYGLRVEGYTNFLWLLLLIFFKQIGVGYFFTLSFLSPLLSVVTLLVTFVLSRRVFSKELSAAMAFSLALVVTITLATNISFVYWTVAGLETPLFTLLTLLAFYSYHKQSRALAPILTLAILTRPEGLLLALFFPLFGWLESRRIPKQELMLLGLALIPIIPFLIFKLTYFGDIAPNPFYAKTVWDWEQVRAGLDYFSEFQLHYGFIGMLFIIPAFAYRKSPRTIKALSLFSLLYALYIILVGGDVLKVGRFFLPLLAPLYISFAYAVSRYLRNHYALAIVFALQISLQLFMPWSSAQVALGHERGLYNQTRELINQLRKSDRTNFSLATSTIGLTGFLLPGHDVYDMVGLTDTTIARHPQEPIEGLKTTWRERKYNAEYILEKAPDYMAFSTGIKPSSPGEMALFLYPSFLNSYRTVGFPSRNTDRFLDVYKRMTPVDKKYSDVLNVGFVLMYQSALNHINDGEYYTALRELDTARLLIAPLEYPYLYYQSSRCLHSMGGLDKQALEALYKAIELDKDMYGVYYVLYPTFYADVDTREQALAMRSQLLRLTPWLVPTLDKRTGYQPKQ